MSDVSTYAIQAKDRQEKCDEGVLEVRYNVADDVHHRGPVNANQPNNRASYRQYNVEDSHPTVVFLGELDNPDCGVYEHRHGDYPLEQQRELLQASLLKRKPIFSLAF